MTMQVRQSTTCLINKSEFRKLIMAKGKAAVSSTGAAMSKYDVEVEKRLQALEAKAHDNCNHGDVGDIAALEAKLDKVIAVLHGVTDFDI